MARDYPSKAILRSMGKTMTPRQKPREGEAIVFTHTHSPRLNFDKSMIYKSILGFKTPGMQAAFEGKWVLTSSRQPANLRRMLTSARFVRHPIPREPRPVGLEPYGNCFYCAKGYITAANGFSFKAVMVG